MTGTVDKLKAKYTDITFGLGTKSHSPTIYLFQKWAYKVEENWYGFDLEGIPFLWCKIIDEFLTILKDFDPEFKINQIKLKFGRIQMYVRSGHVNQFDQDTIRAEVSQLESWLYHKDLIY
jgi:hypothetical protein